MWLSSDSRVDRVPRATHRDGWDNTELEGSEQVSAQVRRDGRGRSARGRRLATARRGLRAHQNRRCAVRLDSTGLDWSQYRTHLSIVILVVNAYEYCQCTLECLSGVAQLRVSDSSEDRWPHGGLDARARRARRQGFLAPADAEGGAWRAHRYPHLPVRAAQTQDEAPPRGWLVLIAHFYSVFTIIYLMYGPL